MAYGLPLPNLVKKSLPATHSVSGSAHLCSGMIRHAGLELVCRPRQQIARSNFVSCPSS